MTTSTSTYLVNGMTCGHCVASVTDELRSLPGVHDVTVDEAGYRLVGVAT
jgi:copper chaperone